MTDTITGLPCPLSQALPHAGQCGLLEEARIAQSAQAIQQGMKRLMDDGAEKLRPLVECMKTLMAFRASNSSKVSRSRAVESLARDIGQPPRARARRADGESRHTEHQRIVFETALVIVPGLDGDVRLPAVMNAIQVATLDGYRGSRREDQWMGGAAIKVLLDKNIQEATKRKTERVPRYERERADQGPPLLLPLAEERLDQRRLLAAIYERCSPREQQLLYLALRDTPESQVVQILGVTATTVRVMWTHIRAKAISIGST